MGTFSQDMRYGVRLLLKHRGFSTVAVLALALGIGANTAIFSVINTVLLKPLPYKQPERLLEIREANPPKHSDVPVSAASFLDWQSQNTAFEQLAGYRSASYNLISNGEPERIRAARVSAGTFTLLGVSPMAGRDFLAEEDQPGRANVVAISHGLWQRRFGGDANLVGQTINLAPALQASKPDLNETLKESGGRGSTGGIHRQRMRNVLVVAEVALALILLAGGGLMIRSFLRLRQVDSGFNPDNAVMVRLVLPQKQYPEDEQQAAFLNRLIQNVESLPRVQSAGATVSMPFLDNHTLGFTIQGRPAVRDSDLPTTKYYAVSPDYFKAMGIPLLRGRVFTDRDAAGAARVAVINETMARRFFPDEDPIGKRISVTNGPEAFREIVGVVGDVKHDGLDQETPPQTYMSFAQEPNNGMTLVLRSDADPATLSAAIRGAVSGIDKDQPISAIKPLAEVLADSVAQQRFSMLLLGVFAAVALVMAAVGLYGVMSYSVAQRTHEIGVRMALGASSRDVLGLVVGQGVMLTSVGVCVGLTAAVALTRLMESLLFGVTATDPVTFGAISLMLMAVAFVASYIPARRAMKVDPMIALRYE